MKIIYASGNTLPTYKSSVIALGVFDGVHRGHQKLIVKATQEARRKKTKLVVITFFPHPAHVLSKKPHLHYLMSLNQRLDLIAELGADVCIVLKFTKALAHIPAEKFVAKFLVNRFNAKAVFVGQNFRFGFKRLGDVAFLKEQGKMYDFDVHGIRPVCVKGDVISSTRLRNIIAQGNLSLAKQLEGRPFTVRGKVVKGAGRGKSLGYPTMNIKIEGELLPPYGVYIVEAIVKNRLYPAMANLGMRPSFRSRSKQPILEVHILDTKRDFYGEIIDVAFHRKIRDEQTFASKEDLVAQICCDEVKTRRFF